MFVFGDKGAVVCALKEFAKLPLKVRKITTLLTRPTFGTQAPKSGDNQNARFSLIQSGVYTPPVVKIAPKLRSPLLRSYGAKLLGRSG